MTAGLASIGWVFTAVLLVIAVICWAAGRGKIAINGVVGIRIPSLKRSEAAWRAGHAAGAMPACIAFGVAVVCSVIGLFASPAYWGTFVALVGGLVWVVVSAARAANAA